MVSQTNMVDSCSGGAQTLLSAIGLILFALPVHMLMAKILCKDTELALPRHQIMLSLTISDALQIFVLSGSIIFYQSFKATQHKEAACYIIQGVVLFFGTATMVASSMSIVTLSIERYISCIYCFYLHQILTRKRVVIMIAAQWIIAAGLGALAVYLNEATKPHGIGIGTSFLHRTTAVIVIPSSIVIASIQLRLLHFSRLKLIRVQPAREFGNRAELTDFRKKQIKITFVASIVAIAYISCMLPVAILFAYEWHHGLLQRRPEIQFIKALAMLNSLADPLIYGIGIRDTRRLMRKNLKIAKDFLLWHFCKIDPIEL